MGNEVFTIGMGEYAFLDYETVRDNGVSSLQTPGITHCFGIGMYSSKYGDVGLIHADISKLEQVNYAVNEILSETHSNYDLIEVYTNEKGLERCGEGNAHETFEELEKILEINDDTEISKNISSNVVDLKATYNKGIATTDIQKENIERLNTKIGLKNRQAQNSNEIIHKPF